MSVKKFFSIFFSITAFISIIYFIDYISDVEKIKKAIGNSAIAEEMGELLLGFSAIFPKIVNIFVQIGLAIVFAFQEGYGSRVEWLEYQSNKSFGRNNSIEQETKKDILQIKKELIVLNEKLNSKD